MKKALLVSILIFAVISVLLIKYTYDWAPQTARTSGDKFVKECRDLNGKQFTFENISTINGFYDLNGHDRITKAQVEQFTKEDNKKNILRIYKDSWFKGPNIKYSWICEIKYDKDTSLISSSANFYQTD